jgi:hypothetical protein
MRILNLDFNNYLTGNARWITVDTFTATPKTLTLTSLNQYTNRTVNVTLYPINNKFVFDLSVTVRALMHDIVLAAQQVINPMKFTFKVDFVGTTTSEILIIDKTFIKGFNTQLNNTQDYLDNGANLLIGSPPLLYDSSFPTWVNAFVKLQDGAEVLEYVSNLPVYEKLHKKFCNYALVSFLNSKGGYQFFVFDSYEISTKNKPDKLIGTRQLQFSDAGFKTIGSEVTNEIDLFSNSNTTENEILFDMIHSNDVSVNIFDVWHRLVPNSNNINLDTKKQRFQNKLKFDFYTTVNNSSTW